MVAKFSMQTKSE